RRRFRTDANGCRAGWESRAPRGKPLAGQAAAPSAPAPLRGWAPEPGSAGAPELRGAGAPLAAGRGVLARGDEAPAGVAGVAGGDQALADEHAVGALVGVGAQVLGALDAGLGDLDHVVRQHRGELAVDAHVDLEG